MTLTIRPSDSRGHVVIDWLDSHHSFSFGDYYDPAQMGFRTLRVINEDVVRAGTGFATHGHRDMEIITYLVRGAIAHKDSTGAEGVLHRGDIQAMSAGTGVRHSELNPSPSEDARFLQIWVLPKRAGFAPAYRQAHFSDAAKHNRLCPLVAPDGADGALAVHQDVRLFASILDGQVSVQHPLAAGRGAWVQIVEGRVLVNGTALGRGDGLAIEDVGTIEITAETQAEILLFDLA